VTQFSEIDYDNGKTAYEGYIKQSGGVSLVSGDKLPAFENLKQEIKDAWAAAAVALVEHQPG
jgi:hypothetical protein